MAFSGGKSSSGKRKLRRSKSMSDLPLTTGDSSFKRTRETLTSRYVDSTPSRQDGIEDVPDTKSRDLINDLSRPSYSDFASPLLSSPVDIQRRRTIEDDLSSATTGRQRRTKSVDTLSSSTIKQLRLDEILPLSRRERQDTKGLDLGIKPLNREEASRVETFVRLDQVTGVLKASRNFFESLDHLAKISEQGKLFDRVLDDLERLKQGEPSDNLEALKTFIEYQVFRTGEHMKTKDEDDWTNKITNRFIEQNYSGLLKLSLDKEFDDNFNKLSERISTLLKDTSNKKSFIIRDQLKKLIDNPNHVISAAALKQGLTRDIVMTAIIEQLEPLKPQIKQEVAKNYMCQCRYSEPSPTLIRRDTPGFVKDRLRIKERESPIHIFETKNGYSIAYDPKKLGLDPTQKHEINELKVLLSQANSQIDDFLKTYKNSPKFPNPQVEFVSFDSEKLMLADVQVPVMESGVKIKLLNTRRREVEFRLGEDPEKVGLKMTDEPAGVFKRSLNSQRVIEFVDWDDAGNKVAFQLKGSGVPAYGFSSDQDWSGGEYLALTIESGAMLFRDFVGNLGYKDVVSEMVGVSLIADKDVATNEERAGRFGAVSFRLDESLGIRLSNITYETVKDDIQRQFGLSLDAANMIEKLAQNMAITNLFGLQYNDSGVWKLVDVGVKGTFADTGGLWNIDQKPDISSMALYSGLFQHFNGYIEMRSSRKEGREWKTTDLFQEAYVNSMLEAIATIGEKTRQRDNIRQLLTRLNEQKLRDKSSDNILSQLQNCCLLMGGSDKGPTASQRTFAAKGIEGFAEVLVENLERCVTPR